MKQVTLVLFSLLVTSLLIAKELPPRAQKARELTTSLIGLNKSYQKARGKNKEELKQKLIAKAQERRDYLLELMQTNPRQVLAVAIPNEKQSGLPAEVIEKLEQKRELEGKLELLYADNFDNPSLNRFQQVLKTSSGDRFELHLSDKNLQLKSGDQVRVKGLLIDGGSEHLGTNGDLAINNNYELPALVDNSGQDAKEGENTLDSTQTGIQRLAAEGSSIDGDPGPVANTFGEQRTLVILMNFLDDNSQPWSPSQISNLVNGTVSDFILENSYGQTWINADVTPWLTIAKNKADGCPAIGYEMLADEAATAAGYNVSNYTRLIYAFPKNTNCKFMGMGTIGGNPSKADINGTNIWQVYAHELGHNLGLGHSRDLRCAGTTLGSDCTVREYGDFPDIMGSGHAGHFNAYQKDKLGWLGYGDSPDMTAVTSSGTYKVTAYESQNKSTKALKILQNVDPSTGQKTWYYLHFRQAIGFDSGIDAYGDQTNFLNGITVNLGKKYLGNTSYLLDMTPQSDVGHSDAALTAGNSYYDKTAGVGFTTDWVDATGAQITVNLNEIQAECINANPSLSFSLAKGPWVEAGSSVDFTVTLTNNDSSACSTSSYNLSAIALSNWSVTFSNSSLSLAPGESASTTLSVTSPNTASDGFYDITVTAASGSYSSSSTVTYVVDNPETSTNSAPIALSDAAQTTEDTSVTINVLANDSDPDGDALTVSNYTQAVHGTLLLVDNVFTYTPDSGFSGSDSFTYTISDGKGASASATVNINVEAVVTNQAPLADFTFSCNDLTCSFQDTSSDSDGYIASRSFSFGDTSSSTLASTTHTYTSEGSYTVTLTVIDNDGARKSISKTVKVTAPVVTTSIKLSSTTSKHKGSNIVTLKWSGASGERVRILRDGSLLLTTANDGTHQDFFKGKTNYTYQVCEETTQTCSAVIK